MERKEFPIGWNQSDSNIDQGHCGDQGRRATGYWKLEMVHGQSRGFNGSNVSGLEFVRAHGGTLCHHRAGVHNTKLHSTRPIAQSQLHIANSEVDIFLDSSCCLSAVPREKSNALSSSCLQLFFAHVRQTTSGVQVSRSQGCALCLASMFFVSNVIPSSDIHLYQCFRRC